MTPADLYNADLSDADLYNANLRGADLRGANLRNANLRGADLRGANLRNANLSNADLSNADLSNADLRNANLRNADLSNADLSNADLSNANLSDAKTNWNSHALIGELLRRAAGSHTEKRKVAGFILISRDLCWKNFAELSADPLFDWAIDTLAAAVVEGDDAPKIIADRAAELANDKEGATS
jgi:uncharacterized protein YjbI with pentapeptide repeats